MKIDLDDPRLTAFALGELPEPERTAIARAVAESPQAQAYVAETQQIGRMLRGEFRAELQQPPAKPLNIMPLPEERPSFPETRWSSLGLAAALAMATVIAAVVISGSRTEPRRSTAAERVNLPPLQMEFDLGAVPAGESATDVGEPDAVPFISVASHPVSSFPLRVGTASYAEVQRQIASGVRPARDTVRIEEMINHFSYDYPAPEGDHAFAATIDAATCAWEPAHRLVRIRIKAREGGSGEVVASQARTAVTFDPSRVAAYRLIGYERGGAGGQASPGSAGANEADVPSGYAMTALYELVPVLGTGGGEAASSPLVTLKLSYSRPGAESLSTLEEAFSGTATEFADAPADFRFAAAVAQFGMILRGPPRRGAATLATVEDWAVASAGGEAGERSEFVELLRRAQSIAL